MFLAPDATGSVKIPVLQTIWQAWLRFCTTLPSVARKYAGVAHAAVGPFRELTPLDQHGDSVASLPRVRARRGSAPHQQRNGADRQVRPLYHSWSVDIGVLPLDVLRQLAVVIRAE